MLGKCHRCLDFTVTTQREKSLAEDQQQGNMHFFNEARLLGIKYLGYGAKYTVNIFQYSFHVCFIILDCIPRMNTTQVI